MNIDGTMDRQHIGYSLGADAENNQPILDSKKYLPPVKVKPFVPKKIKKPVSKHPSKLESLDNETEEVAEAVSGWGAAMKEKTEVQLASINSKEEIQVTITATG